MDYSFSSMHSSKQAWQNLSYFIALHHTMYTYNMAAATLNIDSTSNDVVVTLSMTDIQSQSWVKQHQCFQARVVIYICADHNTPPNYKQT